MQPVGVLASLAAVLVAGADARKFMQGQLTNDVRKLARDKALLGSCNTGQGRVQAVVTLLEREEGVIALFPTSTLERLLAKLRASVFSTKVSFEATPLVAAPLAGAVAAGLFASLPQAPGDCVSSGALTLLRWWSVEPRYLLIAPRTALSIDECAAQAVEHSWHAADLAAGLPQVYPQTQTSFVPQMLNLDQLNGISFDKGCYVGQEVVARARRSGVPRRMFRFQAGCAVPAPGTAVIRDDVEVGELVDAVPTDAGCDLLAVVNLDQATAPLSLRDIEGSALTPVALPYEVPLVR